MHKRIRILLAAAGAVALIAGASVGASELAVSGKPFAQTEADLAACLARKCVAPEDIAASIAHADNLFAAGKWEESAAALEASYERSRKLVKQYPLEVAGLLRVYGHISLLRGIPDRYRMAMFGAADALQQGLPADDPRILVAQVEVIDVIAHDAMPFATAENRYQALLQEAQMRKLGAVEGLILYRIASLYARGATLDRGSYERRALAACDTLIASQRPEFAPYAAAARSLRNQITGFYGDGKSIDRLVGATRNWTGARPELMSFEPIEYTGTMLREGLRPAAQTMLVAFWIQPDGRVRDQVILFASDEVRQRSAWQAPIAASINSRHYAPLAGMAATDPGVLRVESYTLTATAKGHVPAIEMRDMSDWAPMPVQMPAKLYVVGK